MILIKRTLIQKLVSIVLVLAFLVCVTQAATADVVIGTAGDTNNTRSLSWPTKWPLSASPVRFYNNIKRGFALIFGVMLLVFCSACGTKEKEYKVMDANFSWGYYSSYYEALAEADLVVVGTVKSIGQAYRYDYELHPYESKVNILPTYYTPVEIDIVEIIKGDYSTSTVIYNALGGEIDNIIYDYTVTDTLAINEGDEILVFLRITIPEIGYESISPGCAVIEDETAMP